MQLMYLPQMLELLGRYLVDWHTITTENLPDVVAAVQTQPAGLSGNTLP